MVIIFKKMCDLLDFGSEFIQFQNQAERAYKFWCSLHQSHFPGAKHTVTEHCYFVYLICTS